MIKVYKTKPVKAPNRGTKHSVGFDLFIPDFSQDFMEDFKAKNLFGNIKNSKIVIEPMSSVIIPSGLKFQVPRGFYLQVANKSGIAVKKTILHTAEIIDEDYKGEVFIGLINLSGYPQELKPGEKIIQLLLKRAYYEDIEVVNSLDEMKWVDDGRGDGCLGSTGE